MEYKELKEHGLAIDNVKIQIAISHFVCDAVTRQHIKQVKAHNGYYSCERCVDKGFRIRSNQCYNVQCDKPRTCEEFDNLVYSGRDEDNQFNHQVGYLPLIGVVNCFNDFVLDYMHLVLLGVVKRMIDYW